MAAALMQQVVAIAHRHPPQGRGTVGMVRVHPNSRNVIPGRVTFSIDLRNAGDALCDAMDADIRAAAASQAAGSGCTVDIEPLSSCPAQAFDAACTDAVHLARIAPTAMIFVPCKDGISHNEVEDASPAHLAAGCDVLLQVLLERAGAAR